MTALQTSSAGVRYDVFKSGWTNIPLSFLWRAKAVSIAMIIEALFPEQRAQARKLLGAVDLLSHLFLTRNGAAELRKPARIALGRIACLQVEVGMGMVGKLEDCARQLGADSLSIQCQIETGLDTSAMLDIGFRCQPIGEQFQIDIASAVNRFGESRSLRVKSAVEADWKATNRLIALQIPGAPWFDKRLQPSSHVLVDDDRLVGAIIAEPLAYLWLVRARTVVGFHRDSMALLGAVTRDANRAGAKTIQFNVAHHHRNALNAARSMGARSMGHDLEWIKDLVPNTGTHQETRGRLRRS